MAQDKWQALYAELGVAEHLKGLQRVEMLKKLESLVRSAFETHKEFEDDRLVLGHEQQKQTLLAVCDQNWTGISEYGSSWYKVLAASSHKQRVQRAFVRQALESTQHGFDGLERNLLYFSSLVADAQDTWFHAWVQSVQGNELAARLAADDKAGTLPKALYNHYTVITAAKDGYDQVAYATFFHKEVGAVISVFDAWLADLDKVSAPDEAAKSAYQGYLKQYRACLAEQQVDKLEAAWTELDRLWAQIRYWIQLVHDIEYGYGDPLRCKVAPDFSCRLLDETYDSDNQTIAKIQDVMVEYFKKRPGPLAKGGLSALKQSLAGIYYVPFPCGMSLYFRASGQSIPNRSEIRDQYGCKIYFDPVSTAARQEDARLLARAILADRSRAEQIETVGTLVYHVSSHEVGHAIYNLESVGQHIKHVCLLPGYARSICERGTYVQVSTKTLLEEPRAELTSLHTMPLLLTAGLADKAKLQHELGSFMLQDLRRFSQWDSSALRPYAISAAANWARAQKLGYVSLDPSNKVVFDDSKALSFLQEASALFERILDAEDRSDGPAIEEVMQSLQDAEQAPIVQLMIKQLFHDKIQLVQ